MNEKSKEKKNESSPFVKRVDFILKQQGKKRQDLAEMIGMSVTSISQWNKISGFPSADTIQKVSSYLQVDSNWLLYGELKQTFLPGQTPADIAKRVFVLLRRRSYEYETDNITAKNTPIAHIISENELNNWATNRLVPDYSKLKAIAEFFNISMDFLLSADVDKGETKKEIDTARYEQLTKKYGHFMAAFDELSDVDKKYIAGIVGRMQRLTNHAKGIGFDRYVKLPKDLDENSLDYPFADIDTRDILRPLN